MVQAPRTIEDIVWLSEAISQCADAAEIGLAVTVVQPRLRHCFVNEAVCRIIGRPRSELLSHDPLSVLAPEEPARIMELLDQLDATGALPDMIEVTVVRPDGERVRIEVSLSVVDMDGASAIVSFITETARREGARRAAHESERTFRRVVESVPDAIFITDESRIRYANPAFSDLFGLTQAETDRLLVTELVHPSDAERFGAHLREALERPVGSKEYRMLSRAGRPLRVEVSSIAIDFEGRTVVLSFGHEVTERAQLEAQLVQADRLAALGTLAGGMAHAINNPLSYLLLNLDHLSRRLSELVQSREYMLEARVRLAEAIDGAERVAAVIRRMRAFSRLRETAKRPLDVRAVLGTALALIGNEIRHRGRIVTRHEAVPMVWGREGQLEQALLSLLVHAVRAMPEERETASEMLVCTSTDEAGRAVVTVRYPIAVEVDDMPVSSGPVGLSMCQEIVAALGGEVEVLAEDRAKTIHVRLPGSGSDSASAPSTEGPVEEAPLEQPAPPARVLVVDDDPKVANALRVMLQERHEVQSALSGRQALKLLLEDSSFDAIFCDLVMPDLSGMDLYHAIRLNLPGVERRLVFMTGGVFTSEAEQFLVLVPNERVEKPFSLMEVERVLRQAALERAGAETD